MQLSHRFSDAVRFACHLHAQQRRKISKTPYVAHLLRVAGIVIESGGGEDEAIAAMLHDAVEDQGGAETHRAIDERFGSNVAAIVDECTDSAETPKPPWQERKEAFIRRIPGMSSSARRVTAADKLDNVRGLIDSFHGQGDELWRFFHGGRDGTLWYYRAVADALAETDPNPLVESLGRAVAVLEQLVEGNRLRQ
ncbi:MAG: HD domain-containing protein [Pirellulaceae bacterium]|nr:HD domain-containing protein [Pirellulaceae bacterium]